MGLDMYLRKKYYIGGEYEHRKVSGRATVVFGSLKNPKTKKPVRLVLPAASVSEISVNVCYWRKANAIHNWVVENVQNGNDDCGNYELDSKTLEELLGDVDETLKQKGKPKPEITDLKPKAGFFFGSTEIDEWYWEELERASASLREILAGYKKDCDNGLAGVVSFEYHSSW